MKNKLFAILFLLALLPGVAAAADKADYNVVPLPNSIVAQKGNPFVLNSCTRIVYTATDEAMRRNADFLAQYIEEATGLRLAVAELVKKPGKNDIVLAVDTKMQGEEAYQLTVGEKGVRIAAANAKGVFYGIQTLRKSLPVGRLETVEMPAVRIDDAPRFGYRGMMLDCSRHFFSLDFIKRYLDVMAMHNMNVFHWHLTDDQGWRIEIKKYPRLASVGGKRTGTVVGFNSMCDDSTEYSGYYTQEQAREIVEYAAKRYITVIPEIDIPGHMKAALTAYPELGCTGGPYEVGHRWGIYLDVLCLGNEKIYEFCQDVLAELIDVFPAQYIHIGGDETPTKRWEECPKCQALAKKQGLTPKNMQGYFTNRIEKFINSKGRRIIGWDEILEGDINQSATIMSWRGTANGEKASEAGHDVIMTPTDYCYFDYCQTDKDKAFEPSPRVDGYLPIEKVYSFEPCPDNLSDAAKQHMLGVQANVWTEYITCPSTCEYYILPRMSALSEVQWSTAPKDFEGFKARVTEFTRFYNLYNLNYARHLWPEQIIKPWADN